MKISMLLGVAAAAFAAVPATAVVLTFEGSSNSVYNSPIVRSGFTIGNVVGDIQHFHELDSNAFPAEEIPNGTGILFNDRDSRIQITKVGGGTFTLGSFDTSALRAGANGSGGADTLKLIAFLNNVQTATLSFSINDQTYGTFSGAGLGVFDLLTFDGLNGGGGFALDNVTLNGAVPEPASWALMIGGFGLVGASLRRRRTALAA